MKIEDALYHAVHDYPGGVAALAARMGLAAPTLYGMANPNGSEHPWSLRRFREVLAFSGDLRPLQALCEENGGVFVPTRCAVGDEAASVEMNKLAAEFGDVARRFHEAHRDGRITGREANAFDTEIFELIAQAAALAQKVRQSVDRPQSPLKAVG